MLANYIAAALRNLVRNKLYATINIFGVAAAFSASLLIALFVRDEFSYDRWIKNHQRIYVASGVYTRLDESTLATLFTPPQIAEQLKLFFPMIQRVGRLFRAQVALRAGEIQSTEPIFWADPDFFKIFALPVFSGDLNKALESPDALVLTRRMAQKYFGRENVVGESIEVNRQHAMRVAAVIEDLPSNTHISGDIFISARASFSALYQLDAGPSRFVDNTLTYFEIRPDSSIVEVQKLLPDFADHIAPPDFGGKFRERYRIEITPISELHFRPPGIEMVSPPPANMGNILALSGVGVLITLIASINFINLMTARAGRRAVEIGVRKVSGAARRNLMSQFIGEGLIYVFSAAFLGAILAAALTPALNNLLQRTIAFDWWRAPDFSAVVVGFTFILGLFSGAYPAFVLSTFRPVIVLKTKLISRGVAGGLRQALVVIQFSVLIGLMFATGVIYAQMRFATHEGMRLNTDEVVLAFGRCDNFAIRRIQEISGVQNAACGGRPALEFGNMEDSVKRTDGSFAALHMAPIGVGFFEVFSLKPIAGRFFSSQYGADNAPESSAEGGTSQEDGAFQPSIVLNESAVRELRLESAQAAIGRSLTWTRPAASNGRRKVTSEIVGVVPDFSPNSVRNPTRPTIYYSDPQQMSFAAIKLSGDHIPESLNALDALARELNPTGPTQRAFYNQITQSFYLDVVRQGAMFGSFAMTAIFIAALGLFGLAAFTAEKRTKEIGIRKAMGAGSCDMLRLTVWDFTKPVLWSNLIAWPLAYLVMRHWLEGFAYHIDLEPWTFLGASALALVIAVLTVAGHAWLVARTQPVKALRYE